jgi:hypothetical protein
LIMIWCPDKRAVNSFVEQAWANSSNATGPAGKPPRHILTGPRQQVHPTLANRTRESACGEATEQLRHWPRILGDPSLVRGALVSGSVVSAAVRAVVASQLLRNRRRVV